VQLPKLQNKHQRRPEEYGGQLLHHVPRQCSAGAMIAGTPLVLCTWLVTVLFRAFQINELFKLSLSNKS
jgi:hypothetical protein